MFLEESQARERLNSENNLANRFGNSKAPVVTIREEVLKTPGKKTPELSVNTRTEIATRARLGESPEALSKEFGTNRANISHIKNGHTAGINEEKVERTLTPIRDKALERLMASLNLLDDDKLSGCSAKDLSVIASNMGRVVEKTMPKSESPDRVNLIIFAPEQKHERSYQVVEV